MPQRFLQHAVRLVTAPARTVTRSSVVGSSYFGSPGHGSKVADQNQEEDEREEIVDAVVIGGGLAGLSAALTILDAGGRVVLLEKMGQEQDMNLKMVEQRECVVHQLHLLG